MRLAIIMLGIITIACVTHGAIQVPSGYEAKVLGQNFGGGFDYLPNGDIIGMYADPNMVENSYVGIIDANGDGDPASVKKVYDFGAMVWGGFCKVSPDGSLALFLNSSAYKVYSMVLANYAVSEVVPAAGSFDGSYDLAFIDSSHCYVSANPAWGTTNKIMHLNLNSRVLTEIVSVSNTWSGPIDVDNDGNLYYVKNKANFTIQPGDFSVHSFEASKLEATLGGAPVLTIADAQELATGLNGGNGVAWHSSGAVYVSDPNDGKVYKISSVSDFATLDAGIGGGFTVLAFYERDQAFDANTSSQTKLSAGYGDWVSMTFNIYQINPIQPGATPTPTPTPTPTNTPTITSTPTVTPLPTVAPALGLMANAASFGVGDRFVLSIAVQPTTQPFDAYVVFKGPGIFYSLTSRGLVKGVKAYAVAVPGLKQAVTKDLLDMPIPGGVPAGTWTIYAGLMPKGTAPSPANAFALDSVEVTVE